MPDSFDFDIRDARVRVLFTSRSGGASQGPWESLNLQTGGGDEPAAVSTNFARLRDGLGGAKIAVMNQVHGVNYAWVGGAAHDPVDDAGEVPTADALITVSRGLALAVRVADCVPVLVHAPDVGAVAAIHAGRAGLVAGVIPGTLGALRDYGARTLRAWVGPRACGQCYELPAQMAESIESAVPGTRTVTSKGTPGVDIGVGVLRQLRDAGAEISDVGAGRCTIEDETLFSYRRQGKNSGRFAGLVMLE